MLNPDVRLAVVWALSLPDVLTVTQVCRAWHDAVTRWALEWSARGLCLHDDGGVEVQDVVECERPTDAAVRVFLGRCCDPFAALGLRPRPVTLWPVGSALGSRCGELFSPLQPFARWGRALRHIAGTVVAYTTDIGDIEKFLVERGYTFTETEDACGGYTSTGATRWHTYALVDPGSGPHNDEDIVFVLKNRVGAFSSGRILASDFPNAVNVEVCDGFLSFYSHDALHNLKSLTVRPRVQLALSIYGFSRMQFLTHVRISGNKLSDAPKFHDLPNLAYIDVSGMQNVTSLEGSFCFNCPALMEVNMSGMSNVKTTGRLFFKCPVLQHVDMSGMKCLVPLPSNLPSTVTFLDISGMAVAILHPDMFAHMTSLRCLNFTACSIDIPAMETFVASRGLQTNVEKVPWTGRYISKIVVRGLDRQEATDRFNIVAEHTAELDGLIEQQRICIDWMVHNAARRESERRTRS